MNINILLIIFIVLAVWRGRSGAVRGLTGEVYRLLSLVITLFVLSVGILLYTSIKEKDTLNIVLSLVVLVLTGVISKLVTLVMKSLGGIAHLPFLSFLNKMLGIAVGITEIVVFLWIIYVIIGEFDTGMFGDRIMEWTSQSRLLQKLYDLNYVADILHACVELR